MVGEAHGLENTREMKPFTKILIANRGEITVRICRTLRDLEIASVAIYSEADRGSLHAAFADEAYLVGPGTPAESYLDQERIIDAASAPGPRPSIPGTGSSPRTPTSRARSKLRGSSGSALRRKRWS